MNATLQTIRPIASLSASHFARAYVWLRRSRAESRARRTLRHVDARTLRDIGVTRRQIAVLAVTAENR
jgi:uncharacterized protein YjiS (DUF1127 family)